MHKESFNLLFDYFRNSSLLIIPCLLFIIIVIIFIIIMSNLFSFGSVNTDFAPI